ncbi:hypothetical protein Ade02nite_84780 [Paractinoplanes deccanensis]|uniref:Uncharacterized protein n=1 Tax=Paractinoplanes deccanensis TaxID=113561 RepID=A0ABQ3YIM4_9ACTN|nr:hypothetical protein [Actinoplanes deccanensis]GID79837.1 hypothetical protein Ade02nite_84780 [Actinoplanes deccanensis]
MSSRVRLRLHVALLALLAGTTVLVAADIAAPARTAAALLTLLVVPGGAVLARVRVSGWPEWLGLAVAVSLAGQTAAALAMVWTRWWHPPVLATAVAVLSAALLTIDVLDKRKEARTCRA